MSSIFTKIISRQIPAHIVAEDDRFFAFLDVMPLVMGHTLVVPKQEIDYIFDLDDELLSGLHIFAKRVSKAVQASVPCKRIGIAVIGLEVPHAHVHLVPMNTVNDINFAQPKMKPSQEALASVAEKIRAALA